MSVTLLTLAPAPERAPFPSLVVEVLAGPLLVHVAAPNRDGQARIELSDAHLTSLFGKERPGCHFRVWHGDRLVADTQHALQWNLGDRTSSPRIDLAGSPCVSAGAHPTKHQVTGRVHANGCGPGWLIEAFDQPIRGEARVLARAELGADGAYALTYGREALFPRGKLLADVMLVVRDDCGCERYRSSVLRRAAPTLRLDVVIDPAAAQGPSAFARMQEAVATWVDDASPAELTQEEIAALAGSTGMRAEALRSFVTAHTLANQLATGTPPVVLRAEVVFGLLAGGTPAAVDAVTTLRAAEVRTRLQSAVDANHVCLGAHDVDAAVSALRGAAGHPCAAARKGRTLFRRLQERLSRAEDSAADAPSTTPTGGGVSEVLRASLGDDALAAAFARAWFDHAGDATSFWEKLPTIEGFSDPATVARARLTLQLDSLALGSASLVTTLLDDGVRSVSDLVRYNVARWEGMLAKARVELPEGAGTRAEYARALAATVELTFPHAYVAARIAEAPTERETPLATLLAREADFDFGKTSLRSWATRRRPDADTLDLVGRYTRTYRLVRGPDRLGRMRTLLDRGLDSAPRIARMGKRAFMLHHGAALGGDRAALRVYRRAVSATMVAHTIAFRYRKDLNSLAPWAAGGGGYAAVRKLEKMAIVNAGDEAESDIVQGTNWSELFGSADACACQHCQSVLSPAAYLTDLLHFLVDPPTGGERSENWYDKLVAVRPDIPNILLDCDNTDTVLPYIDLVNEVLEHAVVGAGDADRQTTGRAADLALHPEHLDADVYEVLAGDDQRYPWTLPFDLHDEEVRAYLQLAATRRDVLMDVFVADDPTADATPALLQEQVRERLALSPGALAILIDSPADGGAADWGLGAAEAEWTSPATAVVANPDLEGTAPGVPVRRWMRRAQLTYEELDQVLRCRSVNPPEDGFRVRVNLAADTCDLNQARLTVSDGGTVLPDTSDLDPWVRAVLGRIPRFVRLWRALGWRAYDLDKAMLALGGSLAATDGVSPTFVGLGEIEWLRTELKAPVEQIVTWFSTATIPTDTPDEDDPSLYDRRFQDPGRGRLDSDAVAAFRLNAARDELQDIAMLASIRPSMAGANVAVALGGLGLKADGLEELLDLLFPEAATTPLNLANLSRLFGAASFARALKLPIGDFVRLARLSGAWPFGTPTAARSFVEEARKAKAAPLSLAKVDGLLRREVPAIEHDPLGVLLRDVRARLAETTAELAPVADADGGRLAEVLATLLPDPLESPAEAARDDVVRSLVGFVGLAPLAGVSAADWSAALADWGEDGAAASPATLVLVADWQAAFDDAWEYLDAVDGLARLLDRVGPDDVTDAQALLRNPGWVPDPIALAEAEHPNGASRYDFLQGALLQFRRETLAPARVVETLALALGLAGDVTGELLATWLHADTEAVAGMDPEVTGTDPALALFIHPAFATDPDPDWPDGAPDPIVDAFPAQAQITRRLVAIAHLLSALRPTLGELPLLFGPLRDAGWLDPEGLPIAEVADEATLTTSYAAWGRLRDGWRVRAAMGDGDGPFAMLLRAGRQARADGGFTGAALSDMLSVMVDRLGWPEADLAWLVGAEGFAATTPQTWVHERWWRRLFDAMQLLNRSGLGARSLWDLARRPADDPMDPDVGPSLRTAQADTLKQAVRARYDDTSWPVAARPVRDALRQRQRDALMGWLLANRFPTFDGPDDLYRHFLIDVQMCACGETSRVREALSAVQLFVQQGMLGVIEGVVPTASDREAWEWMSRYRVWEANRKVFLWPEHWMEPELRDDKSPFFEDLEKAILKDDITSDNVGRAYHEYLTKLDEVARLEVRGAVREVEPEGETNPDDMTVDRLHVIARTRAVPHRYFHRVREPGHSLGVWGPWRPIDVEIEGDHLLPVVWNRRLYLFWPVFMPKEEPPPEGVKVPKASGSEYTMTPTDSDKWLEVQIAWTRLHEGTWSPKGVSTQFARFDRWTKADTDGFVLMDHRVLGADPYLVLRSPSQQRVFFRVVPEAGIFDVQDPSLLDTDPAVFDESQDEFGYLTSLSDKTGTLRRDPHPPWSLAMSYLYGAGSPLSLPAEDKLWLGGETHGRHADVLERSPTPFSVTPLYPIYRPERQATFPTLFFEDSQRSYVIDAVEGGHWKPLVGSPKPVEPVAPIEPDIPELLEFEPFPDPPEPYQKAPSLPRPGVIDPPPWEGVVLPERGAMTGPGLVLGGVSQASVRSQPLRGVSEQGAMAMRSVASAEVPVRAAAANVTLASAAALELTKELDLVHEGPTLRLAEWVFDRRWLFRTNYHPHVRLFVKHLNAYGLDGLLAPTLDVDALDGEERRFLRRQGEHTEDQLPTSSFRFGTVDDTGTYAPTSLVVADDSEDAEYWDDGRETAVPNEAIDFGEHGTYALYNWELFFHAPLLVAVHLSRNQRYEEARTWFHYIFDPTDAKDSDEEAPQHFWKVKPLYQHFWAENETARNIDALLRLFAEETRAGTATATFADVKGQIQYWLDNPFNPWAVARLRFGAYQRTVVLKYIDNLMEWGDSLFRQYTVEAVDEARLLYVLASDLLGPRPEVVETQDPDPRSFQELLDSGTLDLFSNALVDITAELDPTPDTAWDDAPPILASSLYFCVPRDEKLAAYWDRVTDRLYKIRHCLDIDGVARPLALFDPPIDPGALVRAVAGGAGIAGSLAALNAPVPAFRYGVMVARAKELCNEVKGFGATLLSALEKRDGEALARLRGSHELALLDAVSEVRKLQVSEATKAKEALEKAREITQVRRDHYQGLLDEGWSTLEDLQMGSMVSAGSLRLAAGLTEAIAAGLVLVPDFDVGGAGFGGTPKISASFGGQQISAAVKYAADILNLSASVADSLAATTGLAASHERRAEEWEFQRHLADAELTQMTRQIEAAALRVDIANRELENHLLQRANAGEADAFLRDKFTNVDLYDWMVGQLASVYVQAYQLALDLARRAERAWQFEVAAAEPPQFIQPTHWNTLRKGLLAGERLAMDLHRMEAAYLEQCRREYELTRHVSLAQVDPVELLRLKATGTCDIFLPEMLFDVDRPGLYHRRIKAVALSIPCVAGPYAPVHATLRLLESYVRTTSQLGGTTAEDYGTPTPEDTRFTKLPGPAQGIVTSRGQEDGGLFELSLRDERYLPFEGHGVAHSRWRIELPQVHRAFDYSTISDAILHFRYAAREGGERLRDGANAGVAAWIGAEVAAAAGEELRRVFALRTESPAEWNALFQSSRAMTVNLKAERFPYAFRRGATLTPTGGEVWMFGGDAVEAAASGPSLTLSCVANEDGDATLPDAAEIQLSARPDARGVFFGGFDLSEAKTGTWRLALAGDPTGAWATSDDPARLAPAAVREVFVVLKYVVASS